MFIKKLTVKNFRSFNETTIELSNCNVIIGPNGSGKSNFVNIFRFIKDSMQYGLEDAISLQAGLNYLTNVKLGFSKDLEISFVLSPKEDENKMYLIEKKKHGVKINEITYTFRMEFYRRLTRGNRIKKIFEQMIIKFTTHDVQENIVLADNSLYIERNNDNITHSFLLDPIFNEEVYRNIFGLEFLDIFKTGITQDRLFFSNLIYLPSPVFTNLSRIRDVVIYDLDPKLPKKAMPTEAKSTLNEDGSNLALKLNKIIQNKEDYKRFSLIMNELLPFIERYGTERYTDQSIITRVKETFSEKHYFPASLVSEGTINITMLVIALFFEEHELIIIEEPFKRIHPNLISKIMMMIKEISETKQIIITTHNPEVVKHTQLKNLNLVIRDNDGFSNIKKVSSLAYLRHFLESDVGIEQLFIKDFIR